MATLTQADLDAIQAMRIQEIVGWVEARNPLHKLTVNGIIENI